MAMDPSAQVRKNTHILNFPFQIFHIVVKNYIYFSLIYCFLIQEHGENMVKTGIQKTGVGM